MWNHIDHYSFAVVDSFAILLSNGETLQAMMPLGAKQQWRKGFEYLRDYFKSQNTPLKLSYATKEFAEFIKAHYPSEYEIKACRDHFDYLYDAEDLRSLKGGRYEKKRNHINKFKKTYAERYHYETLAKNNYQECIEFLAEWTTKGRQPDPDEEQGIKYLLHNQDKLQVKIGGIFIDNQLQAFTIGSLLMPEIAQIHVEKANTDYRGLYQFLQQEFLLNEFPDVKFINREDDAGVEQIRAAKQSLHPVQLLDKYWIRER